MKHDGRWFLALVIVILLLALFACKPSQEIGQSDTTERIVIKEVIRDTTVYLTDSAGLRSLLECDSLGRVRMKQIEQFYAGQWIKPKVVIKDNYLTVDCKIDSAAVYVSMKSHDTTSITTVQTVIIQKERYRSGFDWFQIWGFRIVAIIGILYAIYSLVASKWWAIILSFLVGQGKKLFKKES